MAEKTERVFTIPLRKEWLKEPRSKRSNRAMRTVREYVRKHTKAKAIKISKGVNEFMFSSGFKKSPGKIKIEVEGNIELMNVKIPGEVIIKKREKKTGVAGLRERLSGKAGENKKEEIKPEAEEKIKEAISEEKAKESAEKAKERESKEKTEAKEKSAGNK